jgi:hypothetical protein
VIRFEAVLILNDFLYVGRSAVCRYNGIRNCRLVAGDAYIRCVEQFGVGCSPFGNQLTRDEALALVGRKRDYP